MRKKGWAMCLSAALMLIHLSCAEYSLAENEGELHLYQGIPFEGTTPEVVSQILQEKAGVPFEVAKEVWSGRTYGIADFGYEWNLQLDFNENYIGVNRILLSSAQTARVVPDEFDERLRSDLLQFIDVDGQLTDLYGEPDYRFFFTSTSQKTSMFQNETWDLEQMIGVCQDYRQFQSYSVWGNVALRTWVDFLNFRYADKPLLRVMLYYYPEIAPAPAGPIAQFQTSQDN